MVLPIPNERELDAFLLLYEGKFGVRLSRPEAYGLFSRLSASSI